MALFRQADTANVQYVVQSGRIRVRELTEDGAGIPFRFIEPGQMLGGMATLERMRYPDAAEAAVTSEVSAWSHDDINHAMDKFPRLPRNTMRLMVTRIRELRERCVEFVTERVEQRIASAVLRLAEQVGKHTDQGIALDIRLSRHHRAAPRFGANRRQFTCLNAIHNRPFSMFEQAQRSSDCLTVY